MAETGSAEKKEDFGEPPRGLVGRWLAEIKAYGKTFDGWEKKAERVVKRYRNEAGTESGIVDESPTKKFNILWSNVQTLQPAIYSRMPKPDITRTFKDRNPVARAAAVILERAVRDQITVGGFDGAMRSARDDYLLTARGQGRVRYVPTYGEEQRDKVFLQAKVEDDGATTYSSPSGDLIEEGLHFDDDQKPYMEEGDPYRPVVSECVKQEHVGWKDFGHTPAPSWSRVRAVWWREMMTREQLVERFGEEKGNKVSLTRMVPNITAADAEPYGDAFRRGEIFEIWDKTAGKVLWITQGYPDGPLDEIDDPLHLEGFFPCPCPLYGTTTTDSLVPVTDYDEYRTQADEIDRLTQRISLLTEALKVAGAYDGSFPELAKILKGSENVLVPVDGWAMFAEKGGVQGAISFLPIKEIAETIIALQERIVQLKQDIQELTGLSDIVRGQSDPNETLGAQQIKRQFVGMRIKDRQDGMERFARDVVRITAEIVAEQFSPETLWDISGWQHTDEARQLDKAVKVWEQSQQQPSLMMGHNGGPSMDGLTSPFGNGMNPIGVATGLSPTAPGLMPSPTASGMDMSSAGGGPTNPAAGSPISMAPPPQAIQPPMMPLTDRPPSSRDVFDQAVEMLRSDRLRGYTISIETDSMVLEDQQAEKQLGIEFVTSVSGFLKEAVPAAQMYPEMKGVLSELLMFGIRQFKAGTQLEAAFEALTDQSDEDQKPKPPDPATLDAQAKAEAEKAKLALDGERLKLEQAKTQHDMQLAERKQMMDEQTAQAPPPADTTAADQAKAMADSQLARDKAGADVDLARQKLELDAADKDRAHEIALRRLALDERKVDLDALRLKLDEMKIGVGSMDSERKAVIDVAKIVDGQNARADAAEQSANT